MAASVVSALSRLRRSSDLLPNCPFDQLCVQAGMVWRERLFSPLVTLRLFLLQMLHGNTAITHLRHLSGLAFAPASYCEARARLSLVALQSLLRHLADQSGAAMVCQALGRILAVDGSTFSMPDTKALRERFGLRSGQKPGVGYPVASIMGMLDLASGLFVEMLALPMFAHDMRGVIGLHDSLRKGDILVGDRAFCSFCHFALLSARGVFGCFRLHQRRPVDRQGLVRWEKPQTCPKWMSPGQFAIMLACLDVRIIRHHVGRKGFRTQVLYIATTLGEDWSDERVIELYARRWEIETCFDHLKTTMKLDVLKCKTVDGVLKELCVCLIIYNLVRLLMLKWAKQHGIDVWRVSFIDTQRLLMCLAAGQGGVSELIVNPHRLGRVQPRVIRRRMKKYPLLTCPRSEWIEQEKQRKSR